MQIIIVFIILTLALIYIVAYIYKAITAKDKHCYGCPLKSTCEKRKHRKNNITHI